MEITQSKPDGSFVDQAVTENVLKDTTITSSQVTVSKGPRRKRRRLAGW